MDDALKKIDEDFRGAKLHWQQLLKKWALVLGVYRDKAPSEIVRKVVELAEELKIFAEILYRDDIIDLASEIGRETRISMFGQVPILSDMVRRVTYANIGRALAFIRADSALMPTTLIELPPNIETKISYNLLPDSVRHFITIGLAASDCVKHYLWDHANPNEAEAMAEGFSCRYKTVRDQGAEPTEAFQQMLIFAGGATGDPDKEAAALAIVTYFFTTCEIFERPVIQVAI